MNSLQEQSITLFFSDIENSTQLARQLGENYAHILERHRTVIRSAIRQFDGREIDTAGDGFFIVFARNDQAVSAAVAIQQAFMFQSWSNELGLKVRIGIHTGRALATVTGYTGLEVHRASRICSAAHGGQVLLSEIAGNELFGTIPQGIALINLGSFLLKDFDRSMKLFQLVIPGMPTEFPPLRMNASEPRIAVLPFVNLSEGSDKNYFCEGIAEEIILTIDQIPGLKVVARSFSFALQGNGHGTLEVGKRLAADYVLTGTVRKRNRELRVSAELVDSQTGLNVWSERYDRPLQDIFAVQDEIAQCIAKSLEVKLIPAQKSCIQTRQTSNVQAYDFYIQGRRNYNHFSPKAVKNALRQFRKAIELDPEYALAYCGVADCYSYLYIHESPSVENLAAADRASKKAIEFAPLLAEPRVSRGIVLSLQKQHSRAEACFEKAIEINSYLFEAWYQYGRVCFAQGKLDKAARLFEEASLTRPEDYQSIMLAAQVYEDLGIVELAKKARKQGIAVAESRLRLDPDDTRALYMCANGLAALGETDRSLECLQKAIRLDPEDPMLLYNVGCVYSMLKMADNALDCLEGSVNAGLSHRGWFVHDSNLDFVRTHPRFQTILEKLEW